MTQPPFRMTTADIHLVYSLEASNPTKRSALDAPSNRASPTKPKKASSANRDKKGGSTHKP
jgi:hypothetical protein